MMPSSTYWHKGGSGSQLARRPDSRQGGDLPSASQRDWEEINELVQQTLLAFEGHSETRLNPGGNLRLERREAPATRARCAWSSCRFDAKEKNTEKKVHMPRIE